MRSLDDGRRDRGAGLKLTNLDKVMYPETGFTKGEVVDYYVRVAPAMLPHIEDRGITMRRYPDEVDGNDFFAKRCPTTGPTGFPLPSAPVTARAGCTTACVLNEVAPLAWAGNLAALEIHAPMAKAEDPDTPTMVVFDLDPGAPATITECCQVGLDIREVLAGLDLEAFPKTSGSKGLQVYVPLNTKGVTHDQASEFALAVAQLLEKRSPERVTSVMKKSLRKGRCSWTGARTASTRPPSPCTRCGPALSPRSPPP